MKNPLSNLHEALVFQLEGLYDAEKKLEKSMRICANKVMSQTLRAEITKYGEQASDKRIKLKRAFSYLGCGPFGRKNRVMRDLIKDMLELSEYTTEGRIRDAMVIAFMKNITHYKIEDYCTAQSFAIELQLDTVADLLHEIIHWERVTGETLAKIALDQINVRAKQSRLAGAIH